jgi:outer membrane protein assembly factor BamB
LVYDRNWPQAQTLSRYLRLTRRLNQDQEAILDWAEALAPRQTASRVAAKAIMKPEWRHPLIVELSKEAYNVLAELEAALEGKAYRDACQIISTAGNQGGAAGGSGLLPDTRDADLLLSFPNAVRKAMREHPALSTAMNEQFGATGRLRVRQAIADEDALAVEAATLQFCGSQAAAEAHRWLGDRAVASGAFAQAIAHYDECVKTAAPETRAKAVSGSRLAGAMIGRPAPEGAVGPAEFGDLRLSAAEFSRLLDDLRQTRATSATGSLSTAATAGANAPAASAFAANARGRLDGDTGENPQNVPGELQQQGVDWVARQCSLAPVGDRLIVSNRFQVSAFNVKSGQYGWRTMLGGEQAAAHDWSLTPMRPLVTTQRVFVRRLTKQGPLLAAIDLADGKVLWMTRAEPEKSVVSDPALIQDQLFALTAAKVDQEFVLSLASYDSASGATVSSRPLARLREAWWQQQRSCQVAPLEDSLVVACGGSVLRVDVAGRIGWLRRATWTPAALDRAGGMQEPTPPIVAGDRLFVAQPGVRQIQCLDPESGRLIWQTATPTLRRVVGLAGERLVIQSDSGFAALSAADGKLLWEHPIPAVPVSGTPFAGVLDGQMMSGSDTLLAAKNVPVGDDKNFVPTLVWIDLAAGRESALWGLDELRHERPRLGPLAMADGRLFCLSGHGEQEAHRDIVELVAEGPAWIGPSEKQAELSPWRRQIDPALREAAAEVLPKWCLLGGPTDKKHPLRIAEWQGESQVLEVQAASGRPFSLARRGQVPPGSPKLVARVASDAKWKLEVQAGDKTIASQTLDRESTGGGWKDIELNLESVAGQTVWLVVRQIDIDGSQPLVKWKTLEIRD